MRVFGLKEISAHPTRRSIFKGNSPRVSTSTRRYSKYKGPFRFCVKRFGRVLGPLSSGSAALGAPFLGSGRERALKVGPFRMLVF